ncbi:MAG: hypothetical protein AAFX54_02260 [Pseudomonadota bacterium]
MIDTDIATLAILAGTGFFGVVIGLLAGFRFADRRLKRHYAEVRSEVTRLRAVAEEKLSDDEPDLDSMLRNLNEAVQDTFKAAAALENHEAVVARQHEGGKEVIASSRFIVRMIDELSGETTASAAPAPRKTPPTVKITADDKAAKKPLRRLR